MTRADDRHSQVFGPKRPGSISGRHVDNFLLHRARRLNGHQNWLSLLPWVDLFTIARSCELRGNRLQHWNYLTAVARVVMITAQLNPPFE